MNGIFEIIGGITFGLSILAVLVLFIWRPIAHWRALPDQEFPFGGLTRFQWKFVWLGGILTGALPLIGGIYWWLWFARKNERSRSQSVDV